MKIVILSIAVCTFLAGQVSSDGGNIYGSNPVQYSQPQPINYHYPQPHYGSQQSYNHPAGYHQAQQPQQHHGANQFSEQYLVTAIKTDPAPQVVHYQPPSYKPESPFNGQSYIIEPSYVLKPFRPETSYHAQAYRPHNPDPAVYQPTYHAPGYPAYQPPSYPAPVYQPPAYHPQAYPAPAYQNPAQSSVFLVYSTPLLAGYSTQTTTTSGLPATNIQPSATQAYVATASSTIESVSSSPVHQFTIIESTASVPVKWSDILSSDANELGQKYIAENGAEELRSTTQESIPKSYNSELPRKAEEVEQNSSEKLNPPLYPIPANHTSKAVWKIPKATASYGSVPDSSIESEKNVGDKNDGRNQANEKSTIDSNEAETEESSKSSLAGNVNIVGTQNKESSEITSVDQVTEISLQGKLTKYEGRTTQAAALSTSRGTSDDKNEAAVVELVGQVSPQHEKLRSGSSVYYEQGPSIAEQDVNEAKRNGESKESDRDQSIAEMSKREKEQNGEINSEEDGTEATPVTTNNEANKQVSALLKSFYYTGANAKKPKASIQVNETGEQKEISQQYGQLAYAQGLVQRQEDEVDADSNETTEVSISKADGAAYQPLLYPQDPAVKTELISAAPIAAPVQEDESDEVPNAVNPGVTIQPAVSAYQIPYYPPRPIVPKLFRPKQESEEVEPPTAGFGEKIKAFTKFATAIQKVTQQGINEADRVTETKQPESITTENYGTKVTDKEIDIQSATEYAYATEGPTFHASLFYKKPVSQENHASSSGVTTQTTIVASPDEEDVQTEAPYSPKPLFYAQATKKLTASQLALTSNGQSGTGQDVPLKKVDTVKEDYVPIRSTEANYGVRIVAEKISRDQPVQVVNAEPVVQMPVLAHDPMEKTDFYATQRIYTASAESPSDYITTSNPVIYPQDQNPYVTSTYAYIEEAGISAEYQKEIAAAQKEAQSLSDTYRTYNETQSQTEIPDLSQEDVSFPTGVTGLLKASGDDLTKVKSAEDVSSEVTSVPVTESAYQDKTESREVETVTSTAKPVEEVSSEIAYAAVTQSSYQENTKAVSNKVEFITTTKAQSAVDVSLEVVDPVTEPNDQDEATDTPWTRYRIPLVNQEPVEAVTAPYDATQLFTTPDVDTTSFVVGKIFQVDSRESQEAVTPSKTDDQLITTTPYRIQNTTYIARPPPCHADKSSEVVSSPKFLFNTAALANVPLDSSESSGEDTATLPETTGIPEVTTPSFASNESTERTTVASDSYKYTFKSRPTPNRYYEAKTTTALPSINSTSTAQPSSRRPLVVIGKPVEIRKPINGRVYSRPSLMPQRKPQTLAQIKILPTRLRSSTSTIHLPNRRFFIGRSLMASEKGNRESKEDDEGKAK